MGCGHIRIVEVTGGLDSTCCLTESRPVVARSQWPAALGSRDSPLSGIGAFDLVADKLWNRACALAKAMQCSPLLPVGRRLSVGIRFTPRT